MKLTDKKIMITGAARFIGIYLANRLLSLEVYGTSKTVPMAQSHPLPLRPNDGLQCKYDGWPISN